MRGPSSCIKNEALCGVLAQAFHFSRDIQTGYLIMLAGSWEVIAELIQFIDYPVYANTFRLQYKVLTRISLFFWKGLSNFQGPS